MRAVLYARVSTDEQAEKGYSLPTQLEACRKYAQIHELNIVGEITDDYSGTSLDRPGLERLREMIKLGGVDAVIVYTSDRWSRRLAHMLILREELTAAGVDLHFVNRGKSVDTPESRMTENIEGVFNEYWREKIIEASRRGSNGKAQRGMVVGKGKPPYGYTYSNGQFTVVDSEATVIRMIYQWYIKGDENGSGPMVDERIARRLSEIKIPTPYEKYPRHNARRIHSSGFWHSTQVKVVLQNETYAGIWRYGKNIGFSGKGGKRSREEQIPVNVPPIISYPVYQAAQQRREYNKQSSKRNAKREYLLRALVTCQCGYRMSGRYSKNIGVWYYCCSSHDKHYDLESRCPQKKIRGDYLEAYVWDYVLSLWNDKDRYEQALHKAQEIEKQAAQPKRERLDMINNLLAECVVESEKLSTALTQVPADGLLSQTIKKNIHELEGRYSGLIKERTETEQALNSQQLTDEDIANAMRLREDILIGMQNPTFEQMRRYLEFLRVKIVVNGTEGKVRCIVPIEEFTFDLCIPPNL